MKGKAIISAEREVVLDWHEALHGGDVERLVALSDPDIEVGGPRGSGRGVQLLREWVERANIHLASRRVFQSAGTMVVEQGAEWRSADTGEVAGSQTVASIFVVRDGLVASVLRYDDLADALRVAQLDESDEVGRGSDGTAAGGC